MYLLKSTFKHLSFSKVRFGLYCGLFIASCDISICSCMYPLHWLLRETDFVEKKSPSLLTLIKR